MGVVMKKTTLTFSNDLLHSADGLAKEMGISRSEIFRKAMEHYLEHQAQTHAEATDAVQPRQTQMAPLVASRSGRYARTGARIFSQSRPCRGTPGLS
jgi:hypothetical protein